MNWTLILTSMLPEHLLLAGMLAILGREIRSGRPRDGFVPAVLFVAAATAAALWLYATGYSGVPFPQHLTVGPESTLPKVVLLALALCRPSCSSVNTEEVIFVPLVKRWEEDSLVETPLHRRLLVGVCAGRSALSLPTHERIVLQRGRGSASLMPRLTMIGAPATFVAHRRLITAF